MRDSRRSIPEDSRWSYAYHDLSEEGVQLLRTNSVWAAPVLATCSQSRTPNTSKSSASSIWGFASLRRPLGVRGRTRRTRPIRCRPVFATGNNATGLNLRFNNNGAGNGNYNWTAEDGTHTTGADQISISSSTKNFDVVNTRIGIAPPNYAPVTFDGRERRDFQSAADYGRRTITEELSSRQLIPDGTATELLGMVYGRRLNG